MKNAKKMAKSLQKTYSILKKQKKIRIVSKFSGWIVAEIAFMSFGKNCLQKIISLAIISCQNPILVMLFIF